MTLESVFLVIWAEGRGSTNNKEAEIILPVIIVIVIIILAVVSI